MKKYNEEKGIALHSCNEEDMEFIHNKLIKHNLNYITDYEDFGYNIKDENGDIIAGIVASRENQCLTIDYLWVDESYRGSGFGSKLLNFIESIAEKKGVVTIYLNTFGFQAPEFYLKMGYENFGVLENCINGYSQYFFRKMLNRENR
ncbi:GNAT family N-acetyltransferase [Clostridium sp.]|uniref:GNAT family N-acetyltransferase n=1 Tax=Clostridium sp. TaxID=1506 RepID=UPI002FCB8891